MAILHPGDSAKALYSFSGHEEGELSFQSNDIITITEPDDDGWCCGELNGSEGWFPTSYVSKITAPKHVKQSVQPSSNHRPSPNKQPSWNSSSTQTNPSKQSSGESLTSFLQSGPSAAEQKKQRGFIARTLNQFLGKRDSRSDLVKKGILKEGLVFGVPLSTLLKRSGSAIPPIVKACIAYIEKHGLSEEGIYRVPGNMTTVQNFKTQLDLSGSVSLRNCTPHDCATLLKLYLREGLAEPLLTFDLYSSFLLVALESSEMQKIMISSLVAKLPQDRRRLLGFILQHLLVVAEKQSTNRMSHKNLALVFAPTLMRKKVETLKSVMQDSKVQYLVIQTMLEHYDDIFEAAKYQATPNSFRTESNPSLVAQKTIIGAPPPPYPEDDAGHIAHESDDDIPPPPPEEPGGQNIDQFVDDDDETPPPPPVHSKEPEKPKTYIPVGARSYLGGPPKPLKKKSPRAPRSDTLGEKPKPKSNASVSTSSASTISTGPAGTATPRVWAIAVHDYISQDPKELGLKQGELILVLKQKSNGWWKGRINSQKGFFPKTHVLLLDANDPRIPSHSNNSNSPVNKVPSPQQSPRRGKPNHPSRPSIAHAAANRKPLRKTPRKPVTQKKPVEKATGPSSELAAILAKRKAKAHIKS